MDYREFIESKSDYGSKNGFEPLFMPDFLFDFQIYLVDWAGIQPQFDNSDETR